MRREQFKDGMGWGEVAVGADRDSLHDEVRETYVWAEKHGAIRDYFTVLNLRDVQRWKYHEKR